jgi:hypothetical protein
MTNMSQSTPRPSRRRLLRVLAIALLATAPPLATRDASGGTTVAPVAASTLSDPSGASRAADLGLAPEMIPPELGQSELQVYLPETGHTLTGLMLDYWRANGGAEAYGNPISEPYAADGYYGQAFERGVLQYRPEFLFTADPTVRLMPVGRKAVAGRVGTLRGDGRRARGGGDRRAAAWTAPGPESTEAALAVAEGDAIDPATGHRLSGDIRAWYEDHEGAFYLGAALSAPLRERGVTAQYFEGGLLLSDDGRARLAPLPVELAAPLGIETEAVPKGDLPTFDEELFVDARNPAPVGDGTASGRRWIEVSVSEQTLRAYQGDALVLESLVSTGLAPNDTEQGVFHVRIKRPLESMSGFTDATGEVVVVGDATETPGTQSGIPYEVEDVPDVLYFNMEAEALHGAYWHDNFGSPMSHGCVNLPVEVAAFLFGWAPLGTEVRVHE